MLRILRMAGAVALLCLAVVSVSHSAPVATVIQASGKVKVLPPGGPWGRISVGSILHSGDRVSVGPASRAVLRFKDGSQVRLNAGTIAIVDAPARGPASGSLLKILSGQAQVRFGPTSSSARTPTAIAAVRGMSAEPAAAPPSHAGWPSDRSGSLFLWSTADQDNLALDEDGKPIYAYSLQSRGNAYLDRNWAMQIEGGRFLAAGIEKRLFKGIGQSGSFSIEAVVTPAVVRWPGSVDILTLGPDRSPDMALRQENSDLTFVARVGTAGALTKVDLGPARGPVRLACVYGDGVLAVWRDGAKVASATGPAGVGGWTGGPLVFGSSAGSAGWRGVLQGIAIFDRELDPQQIASDSAFWLARLRNRTAPPPLVVQARLIHRSRVPSVHQIEPYTRALVMNEYDVGKVIEGKLTRKVIRVERWALMDRQPLPAANEEVGKQYTLRLEPLSINPQLESEFTSDTLPLAGESAPFYDPDSLSN